MSRCVKCPNGEWKSLLKQRNALFPPDTIEFVKFKNIFTNESNLPLRVVQLSNSFPFEISEDIVDFRTPVF